MLDETRFRKDLEHRATETRDREALKRKAKTYSSTEFLMQIIERLDKMEQTMKLKHAHPSGPVTFTVNEYDELGRIKSFTVTS